MCVYGLAKDETGSCVKNRIAELTRNAIEWRRLKAAFNHSSIKLHKAKLQQCSLPLRTFVHVITHTLVLGVDVHRVMSTNYNTGVVCVQVLPVSTASVCPAHKTTATRSHSWYGTAPNMARTEVEEHELQVTLLSTIHNGFPAEISEDLYCSPIFIRRNSTGYYYIISARVDVWLPLLNQACHHCRLAMHTF